MSYSLRIREEAAGEFTQAYIWYEEQKACLAERFATAVRNKLDNISANTHHYQIIYKNFHHVPLSRFLFVIIYFVDDNIKEILVTAIFHSRRNPKKKFK